MNQRKTPHPVSPPLDAASREFYLNAMDVLDGAGVRYCLAGAYALAACTSIVRHTKDLDVFLRRADLARAKEAFERSGYRIEDTHPHWLAKVFAREGGAFIDLIFRAASGLWEVDDAWLANARPGDMLGRTAPLCAPEELIWSKAMVMERDRFDGADIAHILRSCGDRLDWDRLIGRARGHEGLLLGHLVFFQYLFPGDAKRIPEGVMERVYRLARERAKDPPRESLCRGTLVSWEQYLTDVNGGGMVDARLKPWGKLTAEEIARWTATEK